MKKIGARKLAIIKALDNGKSQREAARLVKVASSTVSLIVRREREAEAVAEAEHERQRVADEPRQRSRTSTSRTIILPPMSVPTRSPGALVMSSPHHLTTSSPKRSGSVPTRKSDSSSTSDHVARTTSKPEHGTSMVARWGDGSPVHLFRARCQSVLQDNDMMRATTA